MPVDISVDQFAWLDGLLLGLSRQMEAFSNGMMSTEQA